MSGKNLFPLLFCFMFYPIIFISSLSVKVRNIESTYSANMRRCCGDAKCVLAFSLFGDDPRFTDGARTNSKLLKYAYPCWNMRVYYDSSVAKEVLLNLEGDGVELINMYESSLNPRLWRFLVARDEEVETFCSRDVDSRLSLREFSAVSEWLDSDTDVHLMIDHPGHLYRNMGNFPISAGMWCAKGARVRPNMDELLQHVDANSHEFFGDQQLLQRFLAPKLYRELSALRHRSFGCSQYPDDFIFPTPRIDLEHVGAVYLSGLLRENDATSLKQAIELGEECRSRKYMEHA